MKKHMASLSGSVTVYVTMIITSVLAFFLALYSLGRVMLLRYGVREDVDLAGYSVLAEYQEDWVEEYGLYMVPLTRVEQGLWFYMDLNRHHMLQSYRIKDLSVRDVKTLADQEMLREEISLFMKERGALALLEKTLSLLTNLKNSEELQSTELALATASELSRIQEIYAGLVTACVGIREDGEQNPYAVNTFLSLEDELMPSEEEVTEVLDLLLTQAESGESALESISNEQLSTLELCLSAVQEIKPLAKTGEEYAKEIIGILEGMEEEEQENLLDKLPFTIDDMEETAAILYKDHQILEALDTALTTVLEEIPEEETSALYDAILDMTPLLNYDRSISLSFEVKKGSSKLNLAGVLAYLRGFPLDALDAAPNQEKDLKGVDYGAKPSSDGFKEDPLKFTLSKDLTLLSIGKDLTDSYLLNEYLTGMFRTFRETLSEREGGKVRNLRNEKKDRRFFNNEVEYVLAGHANEYKNVNEVRLKILGVRTILNAAYLLSDPVKRGEIETLSQATGGILLPGIGSGVVFAGILSCWSLAESISDYRILTQGGKIPLFKNEDSFRTDLGSVLASALADETGAVYDQGLSYEEYEKILLFLMPMELRLSRIQDLLSLNHRFFALEEAVVSFLVEGSVQADRELTFTGSFGYVFP